MASISVVVPVYNVEKYIRRCVNSILAQTFTDFDLILVDDGSPDNCGVICDEFAQMDDRITVIHKKNGGLSDARNAGMKAVQSDWVCFVDSDDLIHPDTLRIMYYVACKTDVNMVICECKKDTEPSEDFFDAQEIQYKTEEITEGTLHTLFNSQKRAYWTVIPVLIRPEIVRKYPFEFGRIFEDNAVSVYWLHEAKKVAFLEAELYFYMINPEGIVNESFSPKKLDFLWALKQQMDFYKELDYKLMLGAIANQYLDNAVWFAQRARDELKDERLAKKILKEAADTLRQYDCADSLTDADRRKFFKALHPFMHKVKKSLKTMRR